MRGKLHRCPTGTFSSPARPEVGPYPLLTCPQNKTPRREAGALEGIIRWLPDQNSNVFVICQLTPSRIVYPVAFIGMTVVGVIGVLPSAS